MSLAALTFFALIGMITLYCCIISSSLSIISSTIEVPQKPKSIKISTRNCSCNSEKNKKEISPLFDPLIL